MIAYAGSQNRAGGNSPALKNRQGRKSGQADRRTIRREKMRGFSPCGG